MTQPFDAIVIGAGQAGAPLAHQLADKGWKVALIEREHLGGSCINYGCTPTKTMIACARVAHTARRAAEFGVQTGPVQVDLPAIVRRKDGVVSDFRAGQRQRVESRPNISLLRGEAAFTGPHRVRVGDTELQSDCIFINVGTRAKVLPIEGLDGVRYYTNHDLLDLTELPEHLLVVGGSYIGLEFGQMFLRFGSRVTVVEHSPQIVGREDEDVAQALQEALESEGMRFVLGAEITRVEQGRHGEISLHLQDQTLTGTHLLLAAGRQPNSDSLNLEAAGIAHNKGWITVNNRLETNVPGVYALGDITGGAAFTHISYNDYQIAYHNLFHEEKRSKQGRLVPYTLYTDPELGRVGLTEKEARQQGHAIKVGKILMGSVARAIERGDTRGLMKIVVDAQTDQVLGAAILSQEGGELVQTIMTLMLAQAPWTLLKGAVFIHPTLTEGFFALMDSVA